MATSNEQQGKSRDTWGCLSRASAHFSNRHGDLRPWMQESGSGSEPLSLPIFAPKQQGSTLASRLLNVWELMKLSFKSFTISRKISRVESSVSRQRSADDLTRMIDWR